MNISSYNIADVGYHYIGLRVLAALPATVRRKEQVSAISRAVLKYVSDKALRLMLPEPRGTFETVGEKVCQELAHFGFAVSDQGAYKLTESGREVLGLLNGRRYAELRQVMARVHLQTYDNLRVVVQRHLEIGCLRRPIVETSKVGQKRYIQRLLEPTFGEDAHEMATTVWETFHGKGAKKIEAALIERVLKSALPSVSITVTLFRSIADRLVSLRLLNIMKESIAECDFLKSYSPCVVGSPPHNWYIPLEITPSSDPASSFLLHICEPDMKDKVTQQELLNALDKAFSVLSPRGGYYDLPDVRDLSCEQLRIPEATFDEGVNQLLDLQPAPLTIGLSYTGISGRRKPLVRSRESNQIYNLIRRA